jgi:hypothetical protein
MSSNLQGRQPDENSDEAVARTTPSGSQVIEAALATGWSPTPP